MHLLILGGKGFIGSRLAHYFRTKTDWAVDVFGSADADLTSDASVSLMREKITNRTSIIFCSTISRHREDSFESFMKNIMMARHVALSLCDIDYHSLIFLSSIDVYGRPPICNPITEKSAVNPAGYYGLSKYVSEKIFLNLLGSDNKLAILRLPGVYSLDDEDQSALGLVFNKLKHNQEVNLSGDGKQIRTYLNVIELANAIRSIIENKWHGLLNMAFCEGVSLRDMVLMMKNHIKSSSEILMGLDNGTEFDIVIDGAEARKHFSSIPFDSLREYLNAMRLS